MANLKEIVEGAIDNIAQETIDADTYYNIDIADGGITNAQMASAIAHPEFFNDGDVYQCIDSGTYTEKHFYKFNGTTWVDVTLEWGYPMLSGTSDPTSATEGLVNQLYRNTTSNKLFVCSEIDTTVTPNTYTWSEVGGGMEVLIGTTNPTTSTVGELGQLYINTSANTSWVCIYHSGNTYRWFNFAGNGEVGYDTSIIIGGANSSSKGIAIGKGTQATSWSNIGIGQNNTSSSSGTVTIGSNSTATGANAISIGASAFARGNSNIQLGQGANDTAYTLKIFGDNIYNHYTHTLTVQNIELNGTDINTVIDSKIASAIGSASQLLGNIGDL